MSSLPLGRGEEESFSLGRGVEEALLRHHGGGVEGGVDRVEYETTTSDVVVVEGLEEG